LDRKSGSRQRSGDGTAREQENRESITDDAAAARQWQEGVRHLDGEVKDIESDKATFPVLAGAD
jgi:hypothetical protein